jgi:hypothetical protein
MAKTVRHSSPVKPVLIFRSADVTERPEHRPSNRGGKTQMLVENGKPPGAAKSGEDSPGLSLRHKGRFRK